MNESRLVSLKTFSSRLDAEMAASTLRACGIETVVSADDLGGMLLPLSPKAGVKLLVSSEQVEEARLILEGEATVPGEPRSSVDTPYSSPPEGRRASRGKWVKGFLTGVLVGAAGYWLYTRLSTGGEKIYPYDNNGDGVIDDKWVYYNGQPVSRHTDRNRDGRGDAWEYYENGLLVRTESDNNWDGQVDHWATFHGSDLASTEQLDTDFNGLPDVTYHYLFNVVQSADWSPNSTTNLIKRDIFENGILARELRDQDGDGTFDISVEFDFLGNPVTTNALLRSADRTVPTR